jgi:hypothetical protein
MRTKTALLVLAAAGGAAALAGQTRFRGYSEVNQIVRERLFEPGSSFQLGRYLEESYSDRDANLLDLLGTYKGDDLGSKFKNGSPNSANMLIWHFLMASLARDVSRQCGWGGELDLRRDFRKAVENACEWPSPAARSPEALESFWTLVMGYDAPRSEFLTWKEFIQDGEFASSEEAVFTMMLTITSNPHFLLKS